jgi:hypothetical protein
MDVTAEKKQETVTVTLGITTDDGQTQTLTKSIPGGAMNVPTLKEELGVPADSSLWVVEKDGKKKVLANHESHNVKEGDHYEALVKGGIS